MKRIDESVVPLRSESIDWSADGNGFVTITMENSGFFNKALQLLMNKPKRSFIHLDEKGSFFWLKADGSHTLEEIAVGSAERFGEVPEISFAAAERFLKILCGCKFIKNFSSNEKL